MDRKNRQDRPKKMKEKEKRFRKCMEEGKKEKEEKSTQGNGTRIGLVEIQEQEYFAYLFREI